MNFPRLVAALGLLLASIASAQSVNDSSLSVEPWVTGLESPTGVAFLPNNTGDALIIQKNSGKVQLIHNRAVTRTLLDLKVANDSERGLLGIALHPQFNSNNFVYLYYTASTTDGGAPTANRIDRYRLQRNRLVFDRSIATLPATPGPNHNGGKILFGPDNKLYAVTGDLNRREMTENRTKSQTLTRSAVILRLNDDGSSPTDNPFYNRANIGAPMAPLNDIYAYGVRNSFGLAFDPVSKVLWDTEPGVGTFDELNRVPPGFNSGWTSIMGPTSRNGRTTGPLVRFGRKNTYADPQFSWATALTPTDLLFIDNNNLGPNYRNLLLVGDDETGSIFTFRLNGKRTALSLGGPLRDRVADNSDANHLAEQASILWGSDFGIVTDLISGPDALYVASLDNQTVYRISASTTPGPSIPEPIPLLLLPTLSLLLFRRHPLSQYGSGRVPWPRPR